jgi:betaine-aldehyde dehydrogenase
MKQYPMIIGCDDVSGGSLALTEPATAQTFATAAEGDPKAAHHAVQVAAKAQRLWGSLTPAERQQQLLTWVSALDAQHEALAQLESQNAGKPIRDARVEVGGAIDALRYFAGIARYREGISAGEYSQGMQSFVRREPIGVVAVITPWNYPLLTAMSLLAAAIAAGNSVVLKPAPNTPTTIITALRLGLDAGFPAGVVNIVTGQAEVGEALIGHPDVGMVAFTGSTRTGRRVAELAAQQVKRTTLELGGKAPAVVFADADIPIAAQGIAQAAYTNAGQSCVAATRIYVQQSVFDEFLAAFTEVSRSVRLGTPDDEATEMGPLASQAQLDKVEAYLHWARTSGVQVALGGKRLKRPGFYYPPTILLGAPQDSRLVQEEIFGPVVVVSPFADAAEAVRLANDTPYGLAASLWTQDIGQALRTVPLLQSGTVWVNTHGALPAELPHGGVKLSGVGKDQSHYALEQYSIIKHVTLETATAQPFGGTN